MISLMINYIVKTILRPCAKLFSIYDGFRYIMPSTIYEVIEFDPEEPDEPFVVYRKTQYVPYLYESNWSDGFPETSNMGDQSIFLIRGWNQAHGRVESFFLNSHHLCEALGLKHLEHIWALSDTGLMAQLSCYLKKMKHKMHDIFDIQVPVFHHEEKHKENDGIRWKDITCDLSPVLKSLQLQENATAADVLTLYKYIVHSTKNGPDDDEEDVIGHRIKLVDYELESKELEGTTFCFTAND